MTENRRRWTHVFSQGAARPLPPVAATAAIAAATSASGTAVTSSPLNFARNISTASNTVTSIDRKIWDVKDFSEKQKTQTGVDWKSLTIPASFPITTDYFPAEAATFHREYTVTEYTLTPEEILGELVAPRGRRMLDNAEIFRELVSQRLAQGFQS